MDFKEVKRILLRILFFNLIVAGAKIILGAISGSLSILSDGVHSLFDSATNIVGYFGIRLAEKPADKNHPYGHRKYEAIASQIILFFLVIAAWEIVKGIVGKFSNPTAMLESRFFIFSIATLFSCLIIDIFVARYEYKKSKELKSTILKADALHTKSHYLTTGAVILGAVLIKIGLPVVIDPIIALFVVIFIGKLALGIFKETSSVLSDEALVDISQIQKITETVEGVISCHQIRTRGDENHIFLDIHIIVGSNLFLKQAHEICHQVSDNIQKKMPDIKDITVHPEPK